MFDENTSVNTPDLFEGMTAISAVLDPDIREFNDRRVLSVFVDKTRMDKKARELGFLRHKAEELGFTIQPVHPDDLDNLTSGKTHGGIVAVCPFNSEIASSRSFIYKSIPIASIKPDCSSPRMSPAPLIARSFIAILYPLPSAVNSFIASKRLAAC